ncbi:Meiotic Sister-Chromatid recombination aldehyde dehydrogenase [Friedmanniomyces endolithicus]|uniref:aldehyde dehydrogenase (NAD(+)) n=1 Tax=Friedmanniomyces endolithicus TaxID=329885 RepID=A0AAN6F9N8_9PEZI|nr:Meiotic Sister-Chromatid recombination aldehyde dehydrogenase [Friedmanniomyces endolithicus]KAK0292616.1 Meiotic Sister-Chromatid recombination aldehyde dehydrogenase [Friedmanniomyces endolithicus]KAK0305966.1 Meiotic Sister-Chromatid recombination aldehyde dehydrogenase [Friedmanniomyces endolithicus]KAK1007643.1 Meiotic Sister-Chromatid recombination aldehyde dehydrogenase [Friedmanniomyces endolithicus]
MLVDAIANPECGLGKHRQKFGMGPASFVSSKEQLHTQILSLHPMDFFTAIGASLDATTVTAVLIAVFVAWLSLRLLRTDPETAVAFTVPTPEQCRPGWKGKVLINPSVRTTQWSGSSAIQCYAPATGQLLGLVNPVTPNGIDRAVSKAIEAQLEWAQTSFAQRRRVLKTLLTFVLDNQEVIVRAACLDSGKTRVDALFGEVLVTAEKLKWTIDHGEKALTAERRPTNLLMFYKRNEVRYEPLGVVAACVSWNYPFHNLLGPIISALFAGNAIIVKNSEQTAWSSAYYCDIVRSALSACGHNPDIVHAVSCWPDTAAHLTSHRGIRHLTFIGSRPIAHEVARSAATVLTPMCVELGGKDAAIVLDDPQGRAVSESEMQRVASIIMRGVFQSAGQNCIGIERVIAMPQAYDRLLKILTPRVVALRVGDDLTAEDGTIDVGAMISSISLDHKWFINRAVEEGARLLVGGKRYEHPTYPQGHYFAPTLLADVTPSMRIAQEEVFAPICTLMRASSMESALAIANGTSYDLGCSVFGPTNSATARANLEFIATGVRAGMVAINDFAAFYAVQLPFGGVRGSGYGRFAGEEGLRALCNVKSVCVDRWPGLIKTAIPGKLDYPLRKGSWAMGRGVVEVGYGEGWGRRVRGLRRIVGMEG